MVRLGKDCFCQETEYSTRPWHDCSSPCVLLGVKGAKKTQLWLQKEHPGTYCRSWKENAKNSVVLDILWDGRQFMGVSFFFSMFIWSESGSVGVFWSWHLRILHRDRAVSGSLMVLTLNLHPKRNLLNTCPPFGASMGCLHQICGRTIIIHVHVCFRGGGSRNCQSRLHTVNVDRSRSRQTSQENTKCLHTRLFVLLFHTTRSVRCSWC